MKKMSVMDMALTAVLAAVYMILAYISVGTNDFKVSLETLAVLIGGIVLGPVQGMCVGLIGELVHQVLLYGVDPTTPLWLIPYAAEGFCAGILGRIFLKGKNGTEGGRPVFRYFAVIAISELLLTALVTPVNYVSAVIQGWGNWQMIALGIPLRLGIMAVRIIIYTAALPSIAGSLKRI